MTRFRFSPDERKRKYSMSTAPSRVAKLLQSSPGWGVGGMRGVAVIFGLFVKLHNR